MIPALLIISPVDPNSEQHWLGAGLYTTTSGLSEWSGHVTKRITLGRLAGLIESPSSLPLDVA